MHGRSAERCMQACLKEGSEEVGSIPVETDKEEVSAVVEEDNKVTQMALAWRQAARAKNDARSYAARLSFNDRQA
jgi:hypothetical protein